jgi:hypothetical protein
MAVERLKRRVGGAVATGADLLDVDQALDRYPGQGRE